MTRPVLHIVSGIPPGSSGTGRLLAHLQSQRATVADWDIRFHFPLRHVENRRQLLRQRQFWSLAWDTVGVAWSWLLLCIKLRWLEYAGSGHALVFHPQTLGFERTLRFLSAWRGRAFLFGLDNSFFCVRSYNHVDGETEPCLRCLGGRFEAAKEMGCKPFPVNDARAFDFVRRLLDLLRAGGVCVLTQNELNAELYRRHIGKSADVQVVGLWTADWTEALASPPRPTDGPGYDVVFHSHYVAAKGADWLLDVARRLPGVRFLYPTSVPRDRGAVPPNLVSKPMTWESGLDREIARAKIVAVPSLWSATIEGALVKSILFGRATARVRARSSYGEELPKGLVLDLDADPEIAARELGAAVKNAWQPDASLRQNWAADFERENRDLLRRILRAIKSSLAGTAPVPPAGGAKDPIPSPVAAHGLSMETLGTKYGGWRVPVDRIDRSSICYCVGAGEDISFDCALIERFGCEVFVFDPTPRSIAHVAELKRRVAAGEVMPVNNNAEVHYTLPAEKLDRLHFRPYGVWSEDTRQKFFRPKNDAHVSHSILNLQKTDAYFEAECRRLATLMKEFGHSRIDLLKLDVEGAEYEVLKSMIADGIAPRILCIEFDEGNQPLDGGSRGRIAEAIRDVQQAGFVFVERDRWNAIFVREDELGPRAASSLSRLA